MTQVDAERVARRPALGNLLRRETALFQHQLELIEPQMSGEAQRPSKYYATQEVLTGVTKLFNRVIEWVEARRSTSLSTMEMTSQTSANITS